MPRFYKQDRTKTITPLATSDGSKPGGLSISIDANTSGVAEVIAQLESELTAYKQDAERYIWLRDYSPRPQTDSEQSTDGEQEPWEAGGAAEGAGYGEQLDKLCDEGLAVLKASSNPTGDDQ